MIEINESTSASYPPRTYHNAKNSDLTVAFATDFNSAGERLTHKAAGDKYVAIPLDMPPIEAARALFKALRNRNAKVLNVAGNGIYTLAKKGWTQDSVNKYLFEVISKVHEFHPLDKVISGGQTGIDIAGVIAAHALGIPVVATLPNGFIQRGLSETDVCMGHDAIRDQVEQGAAALKSKPDVMNTERPGAGTRKTYEGLVTSLLPHQIFVFGSNPVGINGNPEKGTGGAALVATQNGWVHQYEKMDNKLAESGLAWGLTTVSYPGKKLSKTPEEIKKGIAKLYAFARIHPEKEFLVASGSGRNLNGYTNDELADMFNAVSIPSNMVFEKGFAELIATRVPQEQVVEGMEPKSIENPSVHKPIFNRSR